MLFQNLSPAPPIPAGRVAWYVTGRFYATAAGSTQDLGYFLHVEGIAADLFAGPISEANALLTFRSTPFTAQTLTNGDLALSLDPAGDFSVYLNQPGTGKSNPSFDDPDSFSQGQRVATFRRTGVVLGTTLTGPKVAANTFSAVPVESVLFEIGGTVYDFAKHLPDGITQWGTASTTLLPPVGLFTTVVPFVGSAIKVG